MNSIQGKTAIITGAAGGMGKAFAQALYEKGVRLFLTDIKENLPYDIPCEYFRADLSDEGSAQTVAGECIKSYGSIDILINNAGIASKDCLENVTKQTVIRHFEINSCAPLFMSRACIPYMEKTGEGDIITMSSVAGMYPYTGQGVYAASKSAQAIFMQTLAMELFDRGSSVRVHTLYPSGIDTDMIRVTRPDLKGDDYSRPFEIAEIAVFILEHRNNSVVDEIKIRRHAKRPFEP